MGFSLKIKTKNGGQHIIRWVKPRSFALELKTDSDFSDLSDETKVGELTKKIEELTKIPPPIEIRSGFPPKVLAAGDEATLKSSGISSGGERHQLAQSEAISGCFVLLVP